MNPTDHLFGEIAVAIGLLTHDDLLRVIELQAARPETKLGQLCIQMDLLTSDSVQQVLGEQDRILRKRRGVPPPPPRAPRARRQASPTVEHLGSSDEDRTPSRDRHGDLLGRLAVDSGLITMEQLAQLTRRQSLPGAKPFGQLLLDAGLATEHQLGQLLATQAQLRERNRAFKTSGTQPAIPSGGAATAIAEAAGQARARGVPPPPPQAPPRAAPSSVPKAPPARRASGARPPAAPPAKAPAEAGGPPPAQARMNVPASGRELDRWLARAQELRASDVHLHAGAPVKVRRTTVLDNLSEEQLAPETLRSLLLEALGPEQQTLLKERGELDFAYTVEGIGRFRANVFEDHRGLCGVFRYVAANPPTLHDLNLPADLARVVNYHQGLVLITGPAGCGKTSTLAALINLLNEERTDHVLTVEDPVEYLHPSKRCLVNQRQVVRDTESFSRALRAALREDPDVICIGELRDLETVSLALSAAETGHLVLATMHNSNAIRAINSLVGSYPPDQQPQVRTMLSESLRAVVAQRLLPTVGGKEMALALELLYVNRAISNLIRESRTVQINSVLQTGRGEGMRMLDHSIQELLQQGIISKEVAQAAAENPQLFS